MKRLFSLLMCMFLTFTFSVGFASNEKPKTTEFNNHEVSLMANIVDSVEVAEMNYFPLHFEVGWIDSKSYSYELQKPTIQEKFIYNVTDTLKDNSTSYSRKISKKWIHYSL